MVYLNALGAQRIPDPTTAGDFLSPLLVRVDVMTLMDAINKARQRVLGPAAIPEFFEQAGILDADGTLVPSDAECKQGMDFAYDGQYGYHPLLISLANTGEPLFFVQPQWQPSFVQLAHVFLVDKAVRSFCLETGFRTILLRGDTDYSPDQASGSLGRRRQHPLHLRV